MSSSEIDEYQAIQKSFNRVLLRIQTNSSKTDEKKLTGILRKNIQNVFSSYNCQIPSIEVRFEPPIKNPKSGKLIRVHREFDF
ncbi:MAG: hypothetical protein FK732_07775 [Asgard group archaeon]|nr:hypothetical protein [Asgard group archaeon]